MKRIHEYKRQLLNVLHVAAVYLRMKARPRATSRSRAPYLFGGKAAPGYAMAKPIIKLINSVGRRRQPRRRTCAGASQVVFLPNYRVSLAERIFPAADLSEQISTAGKEASGTGNMKFALNGALTIGTLDGANVEIREEVGAENFFLFGLTAERGAARCGGAGYDPWEVYRTDRRAQGGARRALRPASSRRASRGSSGRSSTRCSNGGDPYLVLADFAAYVRLPGARSSAAYRDPERWTRMAILNVARTGKFSSDRTIREYAERDLGHRARPRRRGLTAPPSGAAPRRALRARGAGARRARTAAAAPSRGRRGRRVPARRRSPPRPRAALRCTAAPTGSRMETAAMPRGRAPRTRCQGTSCRPPRSAARA